MTKLLKLLSRRSLDSAFGNSWGPRFAIVVLAARASLGWAADNSVLTKPLPPSLGSPAAVTSAASPSASASLSASQKTATEAAPQATSNLTKPKSATQAESTAVSPAVKAHLQEVELIKFVGGAIDWYQLSQADPLVDSPTEVLLAQRTQESAEAILRLVFEYARAKATLIIAKQEPSTAELTPRANHLLQQRAVVDREVEALKAKIESLKKQLAGAPRKKNRDEINQQLAGVQNELELNQARADFLATLSQFETGSQPGPKDSLMEQIDALEKSILPARESGESAPQPARSAASPSPNQAAKIPEATGMVALIQKWLNFQRQQNDVVQRSAATLQLQKDVIKRIDDSRTQVRAIEGRAAALASSSDVGSTAGTLKQRQHEFQDLLAQRKLLSSAMLPLSKAELLLDDFETNLSHWHAGIGQRQLVILKGLLWQFGLLGAALLAIFVFAHVWRRLSYHYIDDVRRRRQVLKLRNVLIGILIAAVLLINFLSELGSLATVIGFGAAGIAIALQDVILSAAGYFRISGRFGIKVGDWVELMGVRGEVLDIGLTKLSLLELGGQHGERGPTGRVAVLPNSAVFKEKFVNRGYGTVFTWRDVTLTIGPECDYRLAEKTMLGVVEDVFAKYRDQARRDSREMERRLNLQVDAPRPHARIDVTPSGVQISVNYPVDVRNQTSVADEISRRLLDAFKREPSLRLVAPSAPNIQFAPKPAELQETSEPDVRRQA